VIRYMLDTDTCISLLKARPEKITRKLSRLPVEDVGISSVVSAELWYGVALSEKKKQNEAALRDFLGFVNVLDWPAGACPSYGRIRAHLRKKGTPIGAMDLLIASHASFLNAVLVTNNTREFDRVPDLKVENWLG
jgi:tRNA(fMet)-specific endonuclease VapC